MSSSNHQFSLKLPDGWEDQTAHTFMGPEVNGVRHILNLVVDNEVADNDLYNFALDRIEPVRSALPGIETLKEQEKTLPSGVQVYEWVYKWVPTDGNIIFKKNIYMILAGKGYSFAATFSKQSMKTIGVEVDRIIDSFVSREA